MATHASTKPYDSVRHQRSATVLGMWIFLATEALFFGGLFVAYAVYRYEYGDAFVVGSKELNLWSGGAMTAILLLGSLLLAIADSGARRAFTLLAATAVLGLIFLGLEFHEYRGLMSDGLLPGTGFGTSKFADVSLNGRSAELFFMLFFCMTGLHAIHMLIGIIFVGLMALVIKFGTPKSPHVSSLTVVALYWHFVDIVWVFLYPFFYLVR